MNRNDKSQDFCQGGLLSEPRIRCCRCPRQFQFELLFLQVITALSHHLSSKIRPLPQVKMISLRSIDLVQREMPPPPQDFEWVVLYSFEVLLRSVIMHASYELRKVKQWQEDLVLANARTDRNRATSRFAATLIQDPKTGVLHRDHLWRPRREVCPFSFTGLCGPHHLRI